jgi:hypothetical protein
VLQIQPKIANPQFVRLRLANKYEASTPWGKSFLNGKVSQVKKNLGGVKLANK